MRNSVGISYLSINWPEVINIAKKESANGYQLIYPDLEIMQLRKDSAYSTGNFTSFPRFIKCSQINTDIIRESKIDLKFKNLAEAINTMRRLWREDPLWN